MAYMKPELVTSPKGRWKLIDVLFDGGEGEDSLAIGEWDGQRVLAVRWNGHDGGIGNPQSTGRPTWFILSEWFYAPLLQSPKLTPQKRTIASSLLGIEA